MADRPDADSDRSQRGAAFWKMLAALGYVPRSVSGRIMAVVFLTSAIALAIAGGTLLLTDVRASRAAAAADLSIEAEILTLATAPALSSDDRAGAQRNLHALQARDTIRVAALYAADGSLFASYARRGEAPPRVPALAEGAPRLREGGVDVARAVVQNGERLGTIYLQASYDTLGRVVTYLSVLGIVLAASLAVALLAARWLRGAITDPLEAMAGVARHVVERRDYSPRVARTSGDETSVVIDAFNSMLDEVEERTLALEGANHALLESEKLYRAIGESIQYGVWVCDSGGRNVYASDSLLKLIGMTQRQCSEFGWSRALHPDDREEMLAAWAECVRTGDNWYREYRMMGIDGAYHPILAQGVAIRDSRGRITGFAGINLDIGRLKATERALREADRRKDEFLATLAHELRNPLAPIRNAVRILDMPAADERQRKWGREVIARQVHHMALLLDDLLDMSRITRGQLELRREHVDLGAVVSVAIETARPLIDHKRHKLEVSLPPTPVRLLADPLRLSQVIANLLTNSAKYTDPDGVIRLSAELTDAELQIRTQDNGIGLSADTIPELFTMFSQVGSAMDRAEGGLGIGLALVKGLVTLHGGTVEAHSTGLGQGSEFLVRLPRSILVSGTSTDAGSGAQPHASGERRRLLVVDDNRDACETLAAMLRLSGYETFTAHSGPDALDTWAREAPHALLLDIGMPGMSGYEVARRLRESEPVPHTVIVALTGWGQEQDKADARAAGFDAHLTKPVEPGELLRSLAELLDGDTAGEPEAEHSREPSRA